MTRSVIFSEKAKKQLEQLQKKDQKRIIEKLEYFCSAENLLIYAKQLVGFWNATYRFRVGDLRILFDVDKYRKIIILLLIGHRREVYLWK